MDQVEKPKIIAIIPARAGSKGIPNKNLRIIGDHPMVYYAIKNALESDLIQKVVVTTDSEEIKCIALQMGADVKWRDEALCQDNITLDAVVYDVTKDIPSDYVVTLQVTSPTLSVYTLNKAIQYTIENEYDTVISVKNHPHLAWTIIDNKVKPLYQKRLNRQYLPPHYEENGAFIISKYSFVRENSRFGNKISVYEIPEQEAIDIDDFFDMQKAETILKNETVGIYVNGNNLRGIGHIYRALEIADEFYVKPDIYYDINQTDIKVFGKTTHHIVGVNGINELFAILSKKTYTYFINDILDTTIDYMIGLKQVIPKAKIVNFEDNGEGIYKADLVFNALYQNVNLPQVKCGEKYYIASKLFMFYEPIIIKEKIKNVFISFGGADPQNYTDRLLKIVSSHEYEQYHFKVVLGRAKKNIQELMCYNQFDNIDIYFDINNMAEIMSTCDIGITSRGRTGYELALLGIPSIAMAQNNREEKHGFVCAENGFSYIGLNPSDHVIKETLDMYLSMDAKERKSYQDILLQHDLRNGRKRVMSLIKSL